MGFEGGARAQRCVFAVPVFSGLDTKPTELWIAPEAWQGVVAVGGVGLELVEVLVPADLYGAEYARMAFRRQARMSFMR